MTDNKKKDMLLSLQKQSKKTKQRQLLKIVFLDPKEEVLAI